MSRIPGVDPSRVEGTIQKVFEAQSETWGAPLLNHLVYARRPALFRAVRGMWGAIDREGLIDSGLAALVNRRVAWHNGCVF